MIKKSCLITAVDVKPKVKQKKKEKAPKLQRLSHNGQYRIDFSHTGITEKLVGWVRTLAEQNKVLVYSCRLM